MAVLCAAIFMDAKGDFWRPAPFVAELIHYIRGARCQSGMREFGYGVRYHAQTFIKAMRSGFEEGG